MRMKYITIGLFLPLLLTACTGENPIASLKAGHVHGLAVDQSNSNRVYIATHDGLFTLSGVEGFSPTTDLQRVGSSRDDFMGFSAHPTNPNVLFSSGHPKSGGNIGFQRSEDGGETWKKISNGNPSGPADFHAMLVHPANPNHIYGWYRLRVHRSLDGGQTWEVLPNQPPEVLSFAGDPKDANTLYIGTISDLLVSTDKGASWTKTTDAIGYDVIFDIETEPTGTLLLAMRDRGIVRATVGNNGKAILENVGKLPGGDVPQHLALDPKNAATMYVFGKSNALYKSVDGGKNWQKVL
ncbi:hypothetical protein HY464_01100 [Candidatus Peregrinibacteria bacterium]|nr:hypothetical protein [Candidatus Peregrinibacteria bacterium]MBI2523992.1 hypothetical protein [Candidatus Peregrinibacteria bacterium]MBI4129271.1 hypothetical protein [Candidatus Peregrinibacteria bacterium]